MPTEFFRVTETGPGTEGVRVVDHVPFAGLRLRISVVEVCERGGKCAI